MTTRHVYDAELNPILGSTFQPTGFPDVGAATFTRFVDGEEVDCLLVESVQSMANRLEATGWDAAANQPVPELAGLPWVRVVRAGTGEFLTSSRQEAHRLASPFVHTAKWDGTAMIEVIRERLGLQKDTPLDRHAMARAVATLDPLCLVHGVFFSQKEWWGQPKFPRAVSAVIEAHDVRRAVSGGRKSDQVRHEVKEDAKATSEGYGSVPFHRVEWTAKRIVASFVVDTALLHSYGLPDPVPQVLETVALWEIRSLLSGDLRLRTACDLEVAGGIETRRGDPLPAIEELSARLSELVPQCGDVFGEDAPLTVEWAGKGKS
jgi:CRISPR-associated protein Csb1